ncbi:BLUF domain-containing protein [Tamlana sp. 2_MG-2023]|uniref:BLUF domain-containing protein n=1 Tax=unclassified Tamlana TaxID=2614803 RepID=UPI0026E1EE25|nr:MULTISPECIES: BLUF domain-containing protein [unclassified Tamlana]MDO6758607.1 BLUF domain-containing protein [Tamlana sp. 2_MG-2023]MDO6789306.1 BLUF domain-containing protein [Tamlana sp. 1_MG-2023]
MLKTICYISDATRNLEYNVQDEIYLKAKANNKKNNITGVLIYKNFNFLQVLEGPDKVVDQVYKKISSDPRHTNLFKVINTNIEGRIFEDYNFGFTVIDEKSDLDNLYEYLEWLKLGHNKLANEVIGMVENFIEN